MSQPELPEGDNFKLVSGTRRPSYTEENARRFIPIFNRAILEGKDLFVNPRELKLAFSTLKHRINEALRYLCDKRSGMPLNKYTMEDYQWLRGCIRFRIAEQEGVMGIAIVFVRGGTGKPEIELEVEEYKGRSAISSENNDIFKKKIIDFLAKPDDPFLELKGLHDLGKRVLETADMNWIEKTLDGIDGLEYELSNTMIRIIK